jgi:hypothetical protein
MMRVLSYSRRPFFWAFGRNAILDEDWDDLFVPPVTYSNCLEQFEGTGRNNFGMQIVERYVPRPDIVAHVYKPVATPAVIIKPPPPPPPPEPPIIIDRDVLSPFRRALYDLIQQAKEQLSHVPPVNLYQPIRPLCYRCGWRQGGPESWDGIACKCGITGEPVRSPSRSFYYGS